MFITASLPVRFTVFCCLCFAVFLAFFVIFFAVFCVLGFCCVFSVTRNTPKHTTHKKHCKTGVENTTKWKKHWSTGDADITGNIHMYVAKQNKHRNTAKTHTKQGTQQNTNSKKALQKQETQRTQQKYKKHKGTNTTNTAKPKEQSKTQETQRTQ